jgi:hypothetical protein
MPLRTSSLAIWGCQMHKKSCATCVAIFIAALLSLASEKSALAQAGSVGGTIGKTDKSASGDESQPNRHSTIRRPRASLDVNRADAGSGMAACARAVGIWFWVSQEVTIKSDGKVESPGGPGTWSCINGKVHVHWIDFPIPLEILSISADGKNMTSENTLSRPKRVR